MNDNNEYYQLPETSDGVIRKMVWGLVGFFSFLIIVVALVVIYAQEIATSIPFSAEQRFVRPYEELITKWYPGKDNENPKIELYLQALADDLADAMDMPEDIEVKVHYLDVSIANAFATLGGHVFIFKGLIDEMPDENSLAMVLSHEIAHVQNRDPVAAMGRGFAMQMLYGFITNDYSGGADMLSLSGEVGMSFFSRDQEQTADLSALFALQNHYGHVAGHDDFFKSMLDQSVGDDEFDDLPEWLQTHPELQKRIDYLGDAIKDQGFNSGSRTEFPVNVIFEEDE